MIQTYPYLFNINNFHIRKACAREGYGEITDITDLTDQAAI